MVQAIKTVGDYELDVLGIPFGSPDERDSDGEYFSSATKLYLEAFPSPLVVYYHGFGDNKQPATEPQYIGRVVSHEVKAEGVWFRVVLDKTHRLAQRVWEAAKRGAARASSGSIAHLARYARDGHVTEWPVAELSIFETGTGKEPANKRAVALPVMKAVYEAAGKTLPDDIEPEPEGEADGALEGAGSATPGKATEPDAIKSNKESPTMDEQAVAALVTAAIKAEREEQAAAVQAAAEAQAKVDAAVTAALEIKEQEWAAKNRLTGGAPHVRQFANLDRYDNLDTESLAFMAGILDAAKAQGRSRQGISEDALKALGVRYAESNDSNHNAVKGAMKMAGMPTKANELNQSTLANYGDEWVSVGYSAQLWRSITETSNIVGRLPAVEIPQGQESIEMKLDGAPPSFYNVVQASAQSSNPGTVTATIPSSKMGTNKRLITVGKLGGASIFTGELEEDSLIPWMTELRMSLEQEAQAILESLVLDGDTTLTANTNINLINGTPTGQEYYTVLDGFRKLGLVTNTGNSMNCGALTVQKYLDLVKLLGLKGINAFNKAAVSLIQSADVKDWSLRMPEVMTQDVFSNPTLENGDLVRLWGYEVINTPNMHRSNQDATYGLAANTAGKIHGTASNNVTGSIVAVRWDQWRMGWKRRIKFELERYAMSDSTAIVATMRVGLQSRDNEAAAIAYNVTAPVAP